MKETQKIKEQFASNSLNGNTGSFRLNLSANSLLYTLLFNVTLLLQTLLVKLRKGTVDS